MPRILVIDDQPADIIREMLEGCGHEIIVGGWGEANNYIYGTGGVEVVDLVLIDYNMPAMNGDGVLKFYEDVRKTSGTKFVFFSAESNIASIARDAQADGSLQKSMDRLVQQQIFSDINKILKGERIFR